MYCRLCGLECYPDICKASIVDVYSSSFPSFLFNVIPAQKLDDTYVAIAVSNLSVAL